MLGREEGGEQPTESCSEEKVDYNERRKQLDELIAKGYHELELTETDEDMAKAGETLEHLRGERAGVQDAQSKR